MPKGTAEQEDRHTIKRWGVLLSDLEAEPRTIAEAQLAVSMAQADKLRDILIVMADIQNRLYRIECWLEDYGPGYTQTAAYKHSTTPAQENDRADAAALPAGYPAPRR